MPIRRTLVDYDNLGRGTFVIADDSRLDLKWSLVDLPGSSDPDTGDIYSVVDRFGRVKELPLVRRQLGREERLLPEALEGQNGRSGSE